MPLMNSNSSRLRNITYYDKVIERMEGPSNG